MVTGSEKKQSLMKKRWNKLVNIVLSMISRHLQLYVLKKQYIFHIFVVILIDAWLLFVVVRCWSASSINGLSKITITFYNQTISSALKYYHLGYVTAEGKII